MSVKFESITCKDALTTTTSMNNSGGAGLFGYLEDLTDISSEISFPTPGTSPFPSPVRKRSQQKARAKKCMQGEPDSDDDFQGFETVQSMSFHLNEACRCQTGFKGKPQCLDASRVKVKKGTSPEQHLLLLENAGYELVKLKYVAYYS